MLKLNKTNIIPNIFAEVGKYAIILDKFYHFLPILFALPNEVILPHTSYFCTVETG